MQKIENFTEKFLSVIKYVIWVVAIVVIGVVVTAWGYCTLTHKDKAVTEGTYEGYSIGDSMQTVFNKASKYFENQKILGTFSTKKYGFAERNNEIFKEYNRVQHNDEVWFIDTWRRLGSHGDVVWREKFSFTPRDFTAISFFEIWEIFSFDSRDRITFYFQKGKLIKLHRSRNMCTI